MLFIHRKFKRILSIPTGDNVAFNASVTALETASEIVLERLSRSAAIFEYGTLLALVTTHFSRQLALLLLFII